MKIYLICLLLLTSLLFACNNANVEKLKSENDSLRTALTEKDSAEQLFSSKMNLLSNNISKIDSTKKAVQEALLNKKLSEKEKEQILSQMESVRIIINQTDSMMGSISTGDFLNGGLKDMVAIMMGQIEQKKLEVGQLKSDLAGTDQAFEDFDYHLELLSEVNNEQAALIKQQEERLNECWYIVGSYKELRNKEVIGKVKGFLKLTKKMEGAVDMSLFTKADRREFTEIKLQGKKVDIVTSHPKKSFTETLNNGHYKLTITEPKDFWGTSKYLVMVVD